MKNFEGGTKRLLSRCSYEWSKSYEEVLELKIQMNVLDEAYEEMREWGTYIMNQSQAMFETI